jgi:hypothetical protein
MLTSIHARPTDKREGDASQVLSDQGTFNAIQGMFSANQGAFSLRRSSVGT